MKIRFTFLPGLVLLVSFPYALFSQCAGGTAPFTITHDTTVTGIGNSSRSLSFAKFDPSLGTLLSADLTSVSKLQYSYTLTNNDASLSHTYKTQIVRTDDIYSTALDPGAVNELNSTAPVLATLAAGAHVDVGPKVMTYTINNSITDSRLINFEGPGNVVFDYETGTSAFTTLSTKYDFSFTSAADTTVFSVTYRYCATVLLSTDLLSFTASAQAKNNVLLNWEQANVEAGRVYEVQVGTDGLNFTTFTSVTENLTGLYNYMYLNNQPTAKRLFFRLKEKNVAGDFKYTAIRIVQFTTENSGIPQIYPTLYTGGNMQVNFPEKGNWQIRIYAADGRKISESRQDDAYTASLQLPASLGNGIYVVETYNANSRQRQATRIIVQR